MYFSIVVFFEFMQPAVPWPGWSSLSLLFMGGYLIVGETGALTACRGGWLALRVYRYNHQSKQLTANRLYQLIHSAHTFIQSNFNLIPSKVNQHLSPFSLD